jgi:hypothetical protein
LQTLPALPHHPQTQIEQVHYAAHIAALEDKIVQRATVAVLNAIYEEDFLGFPSASRTGTLRIKPTSAAAWRMRPRMSRVTRFSWPGARWGPR